MKRMKRQWVFLSLACCSFVMAQAAKPAEPRTTGEVLDHYIANVEGEFVPAAEAMPEDKYSFAPTNGEFKGVRTFAQQVKHVAAVNYLIAAAILGEKPPVDTGGESGPDAIKSKSEIVKFLKDSFAYVHKAVPDISERGHWKRSRILSGNAQSPGWSWPHGFPATASITMGRWWNICE